MSDNPVTKTIAHVSQLQPGERGTVDNRRVFLCCETCGIVLNLGRIWAVGQTVEDIKDNGLCPCHKPEDKQG